MRDIVEMAQAYQKLVDELGMKNQSCRWELPQCKTCTSYDCCVGLDNLRTPITRDGVIVDYEPDCKHYTCE